MKESIMSDINRQREAIKKIGRRPSWSDKVDSMSDSQVSAIYIRLKAQGKL